LALQRDSESTRFSKKQFQTKVSEDRLPHYGLLEDVVTCWAEAETAVMKVLVLFAHPAQRKSSINLAMAERIKRLDGVTLVDLYADYPRFNIDVDKEQQRLLDHDAIILQFPLFWYSTPALLKQWQDLVLEYGFAYGPAGRRLEGKFLLPCVTTGGSGTDYSVHGGNNHPFREFVLPLQQTAVLCGMTFMPPFVLHSANHLDSPASQEHISSYATLVSALRDDKLDLQAAMKGDILERHAVAELLKG